jgi:hypothetical protein
MILLIKEITQAKLSKILIEINRVNFKILGRPHTGKNVQLKVYTLVLS